MERLVVGMIEMEQQFRILHWQTKSFARHKAYGEIYGNLGDLIDAFTETCMGKYGRVELTDGTIRLKNLDEMTVGPALEEYTSFLLSFNEELDPSKDSDLLNIRDEILAGVNQLKYLLTLK